MYKRTVKISIRKNVNWNISIAEWKSQKIKRIRQIILEIIESKTKLTHIFVSVCLVAKSCPTLCNSPDCSQPGSSVYGISQARILEWVALPLFGGSSPPRDRIQVVAWFFPTWATREAPFLHSWLPDPFSFFDRTGKSPWFYSVNGLWKVTSLQFGIRRTSWYLIILRDASPGKTRLFAQLRQPHSGEVWHS